jgi:hypothetical protein
LNDNDEETRRNVFMLWLGGFFSALNIVTEDIVLRDKELEDFFAEMKEACKNQPEKYIGNLAYELSVPYIQKAMGN